MQQKKTTNTCHLRGTQAYFLADFSIESVKNYLKSEMVGSSLFQMLTISIKNNSENLAEKFVIYGR